MIPSKSNTTPLKIAIIGSRGYPHVYSGYETLIKELSERLVERGCEVTVYCHLNLFKEKPALVNGIKLVYVPTIETKSLSQLIHSFLSMCHAVVSCPQIHDDACTTCLWRKEGKHPCPADTKLFLMPSPSTTRP